MLIIFVITSIIVFFILQCFCIISSRCSKEEEKQNLDNVCQKM